jgi:hypothetical protein
VRLTHALKLAAAILVAAAVGVSAASALVGQGVTPTPLSPEPEPGTDSIDQIEPDPQGGPDWAVRVYTSTTGAACVELGRISQGRFGQIDASGAFYAIALDEGGTCSDLKAEPVILAVNSYPTQEHRDARTVLFGRASPTVSDVLVQRGGSPRAHPPAGAAGGFILPLAGTVSPSALPTVVTLNDGRHLSFDWK